MAFLAVLDAKTLASTLVCGILVYNTLISIYRLYFHPLKNHPGPRLWAISQLPSSYHLIKGDLQYKVFDIHEKYGTVVRIAPNELSYNQEEAWQDIYGKPLPRGTQLRKDPTQFIPPASGIYGLVMEPDDNEHARMRRNLSHGFSEKALRDQEPIMTRYFDLLIQRLHENVDRPVDITEWFNFTTFDIIGDLTFGESFNNLHDGSMHYWVATLFKALKIVVLLGLASKFSPLDKIILGLIPKALRKYELKHRELTEALFQKRLESTDDRADFLKNVQTRMKSSDGMSYGELMSTLPLLIVAGSETTATLLSGATYYLLTNPTVLAKLTEEVRTAFKSQSEITMANANSLSYCLAVLNEALRIYPPTPGSLPRITPPQGCQIAGKFIPGNTSVGVTQWAAFHSPLNFKAPSEFHPERWTGVPEFADDKRRVMNPFSVGPRSCLGRNLAYAEMRVVLARLVWNFDMELCEESKGWNEGQKVWVVYEKPALWIKLKPVVR